MEERREVWLYVLADVTFLLLIFFIVTSFPGLRPSPSGGKVPGEAMTGEVTRKSLPIYEGASKFESEEYIDGLLLKIRKVNENDINIRNEPILFDKIVYFLGEDVISPDTLTSINEIGDAIAWADTVDGVVILRYCDLTKRRAVRSYLRHHIRRLKSTRKYANFKETNNLKVRVEAEKGVKFGDIYDIMSVCYQEALKVMPFRVAKFNVGE